ncbi:MAG: NUDIX domain-containing protein [Caldilineaceae bacterium]|nr:NUDIX domain-containing protein [Caldilineaceae bacterium]
MTEKYPDLFKEIVWPNGPTSVQFETGEPPPEDMISNINAVPTTNERQWVVIQLDDGKWEIPGGTVEPGEKPLAALERELLEEAGARLVSAEYIGALRMHSHAERPFRPHMPHPVAYRAIYRCVVELISLPQVPEEGGEHVVLVDTVNIDEAVRRFEEIERYELAELYRFAHDLDG